MRNKIEKILNWYLFCSIISLFIVLAILLFIVPLILGLLLTPYLFLLYILTLFVGPIVVVLFALIPDLYKDIIINDLF